MASQLYQQIELISREKHIEPEIIIAAIEDAMVVAARKYYRTEEDLRYAKGVRARARFRGSLPRQEGRWRTKARWRS